MQLLRGLAKKNFPFMVPDSSAKKRSTYVELPEDFLWRRLRFDPAVEVDVPALEDVGRRNRRAEREVDPGSI